jgi:hypothetical protein
MSLVHCNVSKKGQRIHQGRLEPYFNKSQKRHTRSIIHASRYHKPL